MVDLAEHLVEYITEHLVEELAEELAEDQDVNDNDENIKRLMTLFQR
jgi:hypothetical protein